MSNLITIPRLTAALMFAAITVSATENIGSSGKTAVGLKELAASCNPASAQIDLDINNVRTTLLNGGDIWWNLSDARYEIPKIDPPGSAPSVHALFAGAIWLGGIDAGGQLKIAAQTYRQNGNDFWPGPLDASASVTDAECTEYDRFWKVNGSDIDDLKAAIEAAGGCISPNQVPQSILGWPAKGNFNAKGATGNFLTINEELAPFFDYDGNGIYNPECGDYPVINKDCGEGTTYGDQMIFWVYNDKGNIHTETGGQAIGIQVNALAFAFATSDEVNDMTFYRYKLINKATLPIRDFYMAQWVDADLGCFLNDYVGCDTSRSLGICYNGTAVDADCATRGYGQNPPLVGIDFFEGPLGDPDTGTGLQSQLGMAAFTYYNNDFTVQGNPETAVHYYNYMTGFWKDNTPFTSDQTTGKGGSVVAKYMFPSPPNLAPFPDYWSECSSNNPPADRRFLQSSGPFTLQPGAVNNITVGAVWVRPSGVYPCPDFASTIGPASDKAQALFDNCFKLVDGPDAPELVIRELDKEIIISLYNPPSSNNVNESYREIDPVAAVFPGVTDSTYKFEGYKIYQLENAQVSVQELNDATKARLVAQVDLKNDVDKLVNFTFDASLNADVPELMVDGNNDGISRSFQITEDLFATGSKTLINHKTYYFTAIAYSYNNFKTYNPQRAFEGGQKMPYLQGRRNFQIYSAIPHKWESPRGGTILNSEYGDGVKVTRKDGSGNGGRNLELTKESHDNIMNSPSHFYGDIEYEENKGPISVKVYDPMKVKTADFTFTMIDPVRDTIIIRGQADTSYVTTNATWRLDISDADGNNSTVFSDRNIADLNEQLIDGYGISIQLRQVGLPGKAPNQFPSPPGQPTDTTGMIYANGFIEGTIEFNDPENQWFRGVQDVGTFTSLNWIRSGGYTGGENDMLEGFFDDHNYSRSVDGRLQTAFYDPNSVFANVVGGSWAPFALAANRVNSTLPSQDPPLWWTQYTYGPAFRWRFYTNLSSNGFAITENNLHNLQSVDVYITSDKSKWTRCVVVELGEDGSLNEGGAEKGQIRKHHSWNYQGYYETGVNLQLPDTGRSYFPGYAINVETGERLNMMFGEDSWLVGENGRDMKWNPTSNELGTIARSEPLFGGKHYIYVMNTRYDEGRQIQRDMLDLNGFANITGAVVYSKLNAPVYSKIMWVSMAELAEGYTLSYDAQGNAEIPNDVRIRLRVNAPYKNFVADGSNNGWPKYTFSTTGLNALTQQIPAAEDACDLIRVVPNPYYAYSAYETSQIDNRVKITNLPDKCTVTIYTLGGTLIRQYNRAIGSDVSDGSSIEQVNLDNSLDWDLKNNKDIPVASGVYLIHVKANGVCEKVVKWFGVLRPIDLDTF